MGKQFGVPHELLKQVPPASFEKVTPRNYIFFKSSHFRKKRVDMIDEMRWDFGLLGNLDCPFSD